MKKLLFCSILALTAMNLSAETKTNEATVVKAIGSYIWDNPIKCTLATVLVVDCAINGLQSSIANKAVKFVQESGRQLLNDGKIIQTAGQNIANSIRNKLS